MCDNRYIDFKIADNGEFIDGSYNQYEGPLIYNFLRGRESTAIGIGNEKATFLTGDVLKEGYLVKKGTYRKNWKKRYFILRKDVNALNYFESKQDLQIHGSIKIDQHSIVYVSTDCKCRHEL